MDPEINKPWAKYLLNRGKNILFIINLILYVYILLYIMVFVLTFSGVNKCFVVYDKARDFFQLSLTFGQTLDNTIKLKL